MLSSNLTKPSLEDVNEQTMETEKSISAEPNNAERCDFFPISVVSFGSLLESKSNEAAVVEHGFDTGDVEETAVGTGIHVDLALTLDGADRVLSKTEDLHEGLPEEATSFETDDEGLLVDGISEKSYDDIGNDTVVAEKTTALDADLETMPLTGGGKMTSSGENDSKHAGPDMAASNQESTTFAGAADLLESTRGCGDNKSSHTNVDSFEPALVVLKVDELEVSVVAGAGVVTGEEGKSVAESKHSQIMAEESVDYDRNHKTLVDAVEVSFDLRGGKEAGDSAAGDLDTSVALSVATQTGRCILPVELEAAVTDVAVAAETKTDADISVAKPEVIKEEQNTEMEDFPVVGSEAVGVCKEVEQDKKFSEEENVLADSDKVEVTVSESSMDFEMPALELGGDMQAIANRTEENKERMEKEGVILVDKKANVEESKMEIDGGEVEESFPKLHKLDVVADDEEDEEIVTGEEAGTVDTELETETDVGESAKATDTEMETETYAGASVKVVEGKRKRGKNSKSPGNSRLASRAQKTTDEDVCFICFDGGDLFVCDRRGCGKAYHPSCVNRDEAFFHAKGHWNCGWHLCSKCGKNARFMCYTCTFSLCKACIKDAVILCVRGNKGFCETCIRTVMLIENFDQNHIDDEIDFDDKSSWEYLFKDYYSVLKLKLSLSFGEILEAKNLWKGSDAVPVKEDLPEAAIGANCNEGSDSDDHADNQEARKPKRRKDKKRLKGLAKKRFSTTAAVPDGEGISISGSTEWGSNELLEFVMHMKDGDRSPVSQFDVQALLLEYIKRNKLRDPHRKSQIICDSRLENLFGKAHVGHFEMLKLLESHFLTKDDSQVDDVQGSVVDTEVNQLEANDSAETPIKGIKDKKRKLPKRAIGRGSQHSRDEFVAIDMHNISLIYLRRKLMEDLLDDTDDFSDKVVGTFVRIRISASMQKQDLYRLVLVVGTSKVADSYKVGKRTTDIMLEILNLNKTEIVSIDSISNQDFTEDECKRLRQSIKCGLLHRMTVGDILDKAMELQEARVNDWLESEIMRLSHLRDRASDLGRKKQLRECVEKLQILKTPEERLRRLEEAPQIHADPNMDPNHESEEDDSEPEDDRKVFLKTKSSGVSRKGSVPISSGTDFSSKDWNGDKFLSKNQDIDPPFSNKSSTLDEDAFQSIGTVRDNSRNQRRDKESKDDHILNVILPAKPENVGWSSLSVARSDKSVPVGSLDSPVSISAKKGVSAVGLVNSSTPSNEVIAVKVNETQKMWRYQDPSGKVQGPFSMAQLRKWSNTGYFPADLRIWKATDKQDNSMLLTDALAGRFPEELPSGASAISNARSLQVVQVLSDLPGKTSETPFQLAREVHLGEKLYFDQNHSAMVLPSDSNMVKHLMASPVEDPKLSAEKWISSDSSNLPSHTPNCANVGMTGEEETAVGATSYPVIFQSPASALVKHASLPSAPTSFQNSAEQPTRGPESDSRNSSPGFAQLPQSEQNIIASVNPLRDSMLSVTGKLDALEKQGDKPLTLASTSLPIQPVNSLNPLAETRSVVGPPSQKLNLSGPVPGTPPSYDHQSAITSSVQNPNAGFSNSGLVLPQSENWRPPIQGDQFNVQPMSNLAWGSGMVEPNSAAPALRPGNSNMGWVPMQAAPSAGWVGQAMAAANMNWQAVVQGPAGNGNSGWVMANVNLASTIPNMGNMNPGCFAPPGNLGVQGLMPGLAGSGWVTPVASMIPAVQAPGPGSGWAMPTGSPGALVQGSALGNSNQGWGAQAGNDQGRRHQGGGKYSSERDQGSQGGDSGTGGDRGWNRQLAFGRGGQGGSGRPKREIMCPFNNHGRCKKGAACDYRHA